MVEIDLTGYFKYTEPMEKEMDFEQWLEYGITNGFCSERKCEVHDGVPLSPTEEQLFEDGYDPCLIVVRLGDPETWETEALAYKEL